jgi:hypothetical protein
VCCIKAMAQIVCCVQHPRVPAGLQSHLVVMLLAWWVPDHLSGPLPAFQLGWDS